MSYMNETVDDVRKREHREYRARGGETLARSRYLGLYAQKKLPQKHQERFEQLRAMNLKTGRAWAIKEKPSGVLEEVHSRGSPRSLETRVSLGNAFAAPNR